MQKEMHKVQMAAAASSQNEKQLSEEPYATKRFICYCISAPADYIRFDKNLPQSAPASRWTNRFSFATEGD